MADNKWKQPGNPPPPLFTGKKERDLVKQVNDELAERVIRHHQRSPKSLRKWQDAARDYVELQHNPRRQAETLRRFLASLPPRNKSPLKQSYFT